MKLKGITIIEQHIEKLVLLVFALFAIGVFVMQFDVMGDPNAVKIDNETVSPDRAVEVVKGKALRLKGQMEGEGDNVEVPIPAGPQTVVEAMLAAPVAPDVGRPLRLAQSWSSEGYEGPVVKNAPIELGSPYLQVTPPAPIDVMARAFAGTIDPIEPLAHPELASYLPAQQPLDKRAVTVQGTFDMAAFRALLETAPEDQSVNPLPSQWWQGRIELLDVELIRQETYDDGTMGPEEAVGSPPGRFSLRDEIRASETTPKDLPAILRSEQANRAEIRRPEYYNMIMGEAWVWPAKAAEMGAERPSQKEINRLVSQYRKLSQERDGVQQRLEKAGGDFAPAGGAPQQRPQQRGEAWPSIPSTWLAQLPPPGAGRPQGGEDDAERRREQQKANRIKAMKERIADLTEQMGEKEKELAEKYGVGVDGKPLKAETTQAFTEPLTSLTGPDAPVSVTVWAHDIGAEPGKSYRYKLRVWVTNPLFGHVAEVPEAQRALAGRAAVASADSEWSNVVHTFADRVFFVSGAAEAASGGDMGLMRNASASVDVYEFFYGYWRGGSVSLDQGDRIRVDMTLPELPIFDVEKDDQGKPVVKGSTMLPTARTVSEDALLLEVGVALGAGDRGQVHEAIFGWLDGDLEVRVAEADSESPLADAVWTSSEASKTAVVGQPGRGVAAGGERAPGRNEGEEGETPIMQPGGRRPGMMSPGGGGG